jgi:hypothetical protein
MATFMSGSRRVWRCDSSALLDKHARMMWAILAKGERYDPEAWQRCVPKAV